MAKTKQKKSNIENKSNVNFKIITIMFLLLVFIYYRNRNNNTNKIITLTQPQYSGVYIGPPLLDGTTDASNSINAPYLKLASYMQETLKFDNWFFNIQYYNQRPEYYNTNGNIFNDGTQGQNGWHCTTIQGITDNYNTHFNTQSPNDPTYISERLIVGKPIFNSCANNAQNKLTDLKKWYADAGNPKIGGMMFWATGCNVPKTNPSWNCGSGTTGPAPNNGWPQLQTGNVKDWKINGPESVTAKKVIYMATTICGGLYKADHSKFSSDQEQIFAQATTGGSSLLSNYAKLFKELLVSYADNGWTHIILAFWNKTKKSDWAITWESLSQKDQKDIIQKLGDNNTKLGISVGGANGDTLPGNNNASEYANYISTYMKNNNLNYVDLDLENGNLVRPTWEESDYNWLQTMVESLITDKDIKDITISFAPQPQLLGSSTKIGSLC